jgi:hypothetical protein
LQNCSWCSIGCQTGANGRRAAQWAKERDVAL